MSKLLNPTLSTTACSSPCLPRTAGSAKKVVPGATASLTSFIIAIKSVLSLGPHTAHYTTAPYQAQSQQVPFLGAFRSGLMHLSSTTYARRKLEMRYDEHSIEAWGLPANIATPPGFKTLLNSDSALHGGV